MESKDFNPVMQTNVRPVSPNLNPQQQQKSRKPIQQGLNGGVQSPTFWTVCSICSVKYEYYREVLNRSLRCQQCSMPFIAHEIDLKRTKPAPNSSQNRKPIQQNNTPNHGAFKVVVGSQGNVFAKRPKKESRHKKGSTSNVFVKPNGKRKRKRENGVESSDTLSNDNGFPGFPTSRDERPHRSTQKQKKAKQKQKIYSEESSGNIDVKIKKVGGKETSIFEFPTVWLPVRKETVGSSKIDEASEQPDSKSSDHLDDFVYPDPEFSDFDKDKKEECFASGQIWAVYDDIDVMPRFYAIIKKVFSPEFKLQITWLEADPNDKDECKWIEEKLPNSCGKYKLGETVTTKKQTIFSHQILCEKIDSTTFKVYPRKGETWALFKNWDIKWHMAAKSHKKYDFEFVEILSDYVEGAGVIVAYLAKLKGFVSLYSRITEGRNCSFHIPPAELFRFSHRIPSFKMSGKERADVPVGSYELDPISFPMEEFTTTDDVEVNVNHIDHIDDVGAPPALVADSSEIGIETQPFSVLAADQTGLEVPNVLKLQEEVTALKLKQEAMEAKLSEVVVQQKKMISQMSSMAVKQVNMEKKLTGISGDLQTILSLLKLKT